MSSNEIQRGVELTLNQLIIQRKLLFQHEIEPTIIALLNTFPTAKQYTMVIATHQIIDNQYDVEVMLSIPDLVLYANTELAKKEQLKLRNCLKLECQSDSISISKGYEKLFSYIQMEKLIQVSSIYNISQIDILNKNPLTHLYVVVNDSIL